MQLFEGFMDDMEEFETEAAKNLDEMVESIDLRKNDLSLTAFLDSIKLIYDIDGSLAPDANPKNKKNKNSTDDLLGNDETMLDREVPDYLQSPPNMLSNPKGTPMSKKSELKQAKSMYHQTLDESALKLNLKQIAGGLPNGSVTSPSNGYFSNYQNTGRPNPYMMGEGMEAMQTPNQASAQKNPNYMQAHSGAGANNQVSYFSVNHSSMQPTLAQSTMNPAIAFGQSMIGKSTMGMANMTPSHQIMGNQIPTNSNMHQTLQPPHTPLLSGMTQSIIQTKESNTISPKPELNHGASTAISEKKSLTPSCSSRGEPIEETTMTLTDAAKKLMRRKTKTDEYVDVKGYKNLKSGIDPADFTNASRRIVNRHRR